MLKRLFIRNFVLIRELEIDFELGLNIITGETGAGKSILVSALAFLTGDTFQSTNNDEVMVEGVFLLDFEKIDIELKEFLDDAENEIIVLRKYSKTKGNSIKINNQTVTLKKLKEITSKLVSITNQFEHLNLFSKEKQLEIVDEWEGEALVASGDRETKDRHQETGEKKIPGCRESALRGLRGLAPLENLSSSRFKGRSPLEKVNPLRANMQVCLEQTDKIIKSKYQEGYLKYIDLKKHLTEMNQDIQQFDQKVEFLNYQIRDLETQNFKEEEEASLKKQLAEIRNVKLITESHQTLKNNIEVINTAFNSNMQLLEILRNKTGNSFYANLLSKINSLFTENQDIEHELIKEDAIIAEINETDLNEIEERLDLIFRYKNKYKTNSISDLCLKLHDLKKEYAEMIGSNKSKIELEQLLNLTSAELKDLAEKLHVIREKKAKEISERIIHQLHELNFKHADFKIEIIKQEDFSLAGFDKIDFFISLNLGEKLCPIAKVASGGELSRILLALKTIFWEKSPLESLVFDEIDTGIGGLTALKVGEKLKFISSNAQVFCVTHLPQIAKFADHHYVVEKEINNNNKTEIIIKKLAQNEVNGELERMVGGKEVISILN